MLSKCLDKSLANRVEKNRVEKSRVEKSKEMSDTDLARDQME